MLSLPRSQWDYEANRTVIISCLKMGDEWH